MRKDLRDIQDQKDSLIAAMNRSDVALDGPGYEQALKNYKMLVETEEIIKDGRRKRGPLEVVLKIGGFLVTAAGVILVPQLLAEKAYEGEKDMSLKNGTIWNLIGKNFGPRDK